ncbi:MAG: M13 family metallopeptidase, partial [Planctomycetaceae bacterium]|nr:M13 family metallopeptidase [Planctomycetaceae bacterium]
AKKVGDFYHSYMDVERVDALGHKPLESALRKIAELQTTDDVVQYFGSSQVYGIDAPIGFFVSTDPKDSNRYLAAIVQSGTTLPDRDYYLGYDQKYFDARTALKDYIRKLFELTELPDGETAAEQILTLETRLAAIQWSRTKLRDAEKRYNLFQVRDLPGLAAGIPFEAFFRSVQAPELTEINVLTPSYFESLQEIMADTPVAVWQQYLRFRVIDASASALSKDFVDTSFEFHGKRISGVPEQEPRWKRAVDATSGGGAGDFGVLGEAVGQIYVQKHFPESAKVRMDELVANLMKAYEKSIVGLSWMTEITKQRALDKLHRITPKIGYPQKWRDYSTLEIHPDDLFGNLQRSALFEHRRMIDRLGKPVDRQEWGMTPQTVNAYYNPSKNEIVFPAAILQPPFFDAEADDAANYGGIGAVIGHEISHGFDDQGSKFDGDGNLNNWWTDEDREAFEALTSRLVSQFEAYEPLPGRKLNGRLTLGENIADLSGMAIALKAYQLSLGDRKAPVI